MTQTTSVLKNTDMQLHTSHVLTILTCNFTLMLCLKCRCAWDIFQVVQSIIFLGEQDLTKSCDTNLIYIIEDIDLKLCCLLLSTFWHISLFFLYLCSAWNVGVWNIFFISISPLLFGGRQNLTNFYDVNYLYSFEDSDWKFCKYDHHEV
jgi:hypothetical protein